LAFLAPSLTIAYTKYAGQADTGGLHGKVKAFDIALAGIVKA
jgi:hypothetical protein